MSQPPKTRLSCAMCATSLERVFKCGACNVIYYCGRECQVKHWPVHRKACGKRIADIVSPWTLKYSLDELAKRDTSACQSPALLVCDRASPVCQILYDAKLQPVCESDKIVFGMPSALALKLLATMKINTLDDMPTGSFVMVFQLDGSYRWQPLTNEPSSTTV